VNFVVVERLVTIGRRQTTAEVCGLRKVPFRRHQPQFSSPLPHAAFHQQILPIAPIAGLVLLSAFRPLQQIT